MVAPKALGAPRKPHPLGPRPVDKRVPLRRARIAQCVHHQRGQRPRQRLRLVMCDARHRARPLLGVLRRMQFARALLRARLADFAPAALQRLREPRPPLRLGAPTHPVRKLVADVADHLRANLIAREPVERLALHRRALAPPGRALLAGAGAVGAKHELDDDALRPGGGGLAELSPLRQLVAAACVDLLDEVEHAGLVADLLGVGPRRRTGRVAGHPGGARAPVLVEDPATHHPEARRVLGANTPDPLRPRRMRRHDAAVHGYARAPAPARARRPDRPMALGRLASIIVAMRGHSMTMATTAVAGGEMHRVAGPGRRAVARSLRAIRCTTLADPMGEARFQVTDDERDGGARRSVRNDNLRTVRVHHGGVPGGRRESTAAPAAHASPSGRPGCALGAVARGSPSRWSETASMRWRMRSAFFAAASSSPSRS